MSSAQARSTDEFELDPVVANFVDGAVSRTARLLGFENSSVLIRTAAGFSFCILPALLAFLLMRIEPGAWPSWTDRLVGQEPAIFGLALAVLGAMGAVLMNRAWSANERKRQALMLKGASPGRDELPDLRPTALVSAIAIFCIAALIMYYANAIGCSRHACLFTSEHGGLQVWFRAALERVLQASTFSLFEYMAGNNLIPSPIAVSAAGRVLDIVIRVLMELYMLTVILGLVRIFASTRMAVAELKAAPAKIRDAKTLAIVRLGRRALPKLYDAIAPRRHEQDDAASDEYQQDTLAYNATAVLMLIGDATSVRPLFDIFGKSAKGKSWTRWRAAKALQAIARRLSENVARGWLRHPIDAFALWRIRRWARRKYLFYGLLPEGSRGRAWPIIVEIHTSLS